MEIINQSNVTPHRFHALLKLVKELKNPKRQDILELLQPSNLLASQEASTNSVNYGLAFNILVEDESTRTLSLAEDVPSEIGDVENYRRFMQSRLTGVTLESQHNFLLNQFTAWYAVQNERFFRSKAEELDRQFRSDLYPHDPTDERENQGRAFNPTKFIGWRNWASFLGWGITYNIQGSSAGFVPDATVRLQGVLANVFEQRSQIITMTQFMKRLAECCPELDGGELFEYCWQASRLNYYRGMQVSLMLSTALRVHEKLGHLKLIVEPDASDVWQLFAGYGTTNRASHIQWN